MVARHLLFPCLLLATLLTIPPAGADDIADPPPDGSWSSLTGPPGRVDHTTIYDPLRGRMLLFGGDDGSHRGVDLWELTADRRWRRLVPLDATSPDPRPYGWGRTAVYDPIRDRMIVFGGKSWSYFPGNVWVLDLSGTPAWSHLEVAGTPPPGRTDHTAIYDAERDAMIVFGGYENGVFDDVWMLSLAGVPTWSRLEVSGGPLRRYRHTAIYDPIGKRMIVHGGSDGTTTQGTWALALSGTPEWTPLAAAGDGPTPRIRHAATYDAARGRMIVFGGTDGTRRNDMWALALGETPAWSELTTPSPRPSRRNDASMIYDGAHDAMIVFGGYEELFEYPSDCWELSLAGRPRWRMVSQPIGQPPLSAYYGSVVYDPPRDRLIQFGGWFDGLNNHLHALTLSGDRSWSRIEPLGITPPQTSAAAGVYDPLRDRMLFFGGVVATSGSPVYSNHLWALSLSGAPTWTRLQPTGPEPERCSYASAIYDPLRDRVLVFGGAAWPLSPNDVWALSLSGPPEWTRLETLGTPPTGRYRHFAMYDALRDRMLMFAGQRDSTALYSSPREIWTLSLSGIPTWTEITPAVSPFHAGASQATIYDPVRDRLVAFAPWGPRGNDAWTLDLSGDFEWRLLNPANVPASFQQPAFYDPIRDRMIAFGNDGTEPPCVLTWGQPVAPQIACDPSVTWMPGNELRVNARLTNPIAGDRAVEWTLDAEPPDLRLRRRGLIVVPASGETTVPIDLTMPSTPRAEQTVLRFSAAFAGAAGNQARCELRVDTPAATHFAFHDVRPNPASREAAAFFTLPAAGRVRLGLYDLSGRRVGARDLTLPAGHHAIELPFERLAPGVFFARLMFEGHSAERRVVVLE